MSAKVDKFSSEKPPGYARGDKRRCLKKGGAERSAKLPFRKN